MIEATLTHEQWLHFGQLQRNEIGADTRRYLPWLLDDSSTEHIAYILGLLPSRYATPDPTRRRGSQGAAVSAAQCLLKQQRFGSARVTGRYDRATAAAVRQAQRARGLDATGVMNTRTWTTLLAHGKSPLLKVGSAGESARHLQRALTAALDRRVAINGVVAKSTSKAIQAYERTHGLTVDGVVDSAVWTRLHNGR